MNNTQLVVDLDRLKICIDQGLAFLRHQQAADGEIYTYMALSRAPEDTGVLDHSPFTTSLALYCLSFLKTEATLEITTKALDFLIAEAKRPGLWRFWTSKHPRFIPPDMDDTCCASYALKTYRSAPDNIKLLLAHRDPRGLFYTWLNAPWRTIFRFPVFWLSSWVERPARQAFFRDTEADPDDVDCVVNANVLLYLQERAETRPAIAYLCDVIANGKEESADKWYLSKFAVYYMISRAYYAGVRALEPTRHRIVEATSKSLADAGIEKNCLEMALAACTLMNYQQPSRLLTQAILFLMESQAASGEWPRFAFYYGGPKKVFNWGSRELTTAFCLEALGRFRPLINP